MVSSTTNFKAINFPSRGEIVPLKACLYRRDDGCSIHEGIYPRRIMGFSLWLVQTLHRQESTLLTWCVWGASFHWPHPSNFLPMTCPLKWPP